jgi:hypothetical protein
MPEIPVPILMDSCDYCGGHPACVQLCLPQAIVWKDLEAKPARPRLAEAKQIAERWLASVMQ